MDSFILYTSQYTAIKSLTKTAKGELLDALYRYAMNGEKPVFSSNAVEMAFNFICIRIDENNTKYQSICEKRKLAGRKGGRPRKHFPEASTDDGKAKEKANKPKAFSKSKRKQKKLTDTDTESRSISINPDTSSDTLSSKVADDTATLQKKQKQKNARDDFSNQNFQAEKSAMRAYDKWLRDVLTLFNQAVTTCESAIRPVRVLSQSRRDALKSLWSKYRYKPSDFKRAFHNMATSNYCNGRTADRRRPVDFDWLIREENFNRAYEGSL